MDPQLHISHQRHPIGTRFTKLFAGVPYNGQVETFDVETKYYHVKYDDGDEGDQTEAEVTNLHKQSESDWTVVPGATPRAKFTPATYAGATRNQGQKRQEKKRLTEAVSSRNQVEPLKELDPLSPARNAQPKAATYVPEPRRPSKRKQKRVRVGRKQATRKKTEPQRRQPRATSNAAISPPIEPQTYSQFSGSGYVARVPWPASVTNF